MRVKRASRIVSTLVTVLLLVLIAACAPTPTVERGIIEIWVTDPPPPGVETADVTLANIEVYQVVEEGKNVWVTILEDATFDLVEIAEEPDLIGTWEWDAPSARFTQMRIDVDTVSGSTTDYASSYAANIPSGKLKLVKSFEVKDGFTTILTLDFDGDKSLIMTGEGKFLFSPVVKLSIEYVEL